MADLTLNFAVQHGKAPKFPWRPVDAITATQTGQGVFSNTITAATTGTDLTFGGITPGLVLIVNLDDTNSVTWGMSDAGVLKAPGILYPVTRWPAMFFANPGATIRVQANVAACEVFYLAYEL